MTLIDAISLLKRERDRVSQSNGDDVTSVCEAFDAVIDYTLPKSSFNCAPKATEDLYAEIQYWPMCSNCHVLLSDVDACGNNIVPSTCPGCGKPFSRVIIQTKMPFSAELY